MNKRFVKYFSSKRMTGKEITLADKRIIADYLEGKADPRDVDFIRSGAAAGYVAVDLLQKIWDSEYQKKNWLQKLFA